MKTLGLNEDIISRLPWLGLSSISNMLSTIKLAKYYELTENDILFTIFTDSAELYNSRLQEMNQDWGHYSDRQAEIDWSSVIQRQTIDYFKELTYYQKKAIHNLKYFTWVEQQGKDVEELNAQWQNENYWPERFRIVPQWNQLIKDFNQAVGL